MLEFSNDVSVVGEGVINGVEDQHHFVNNIPLTHFGERFGVRIKVSKTGNKMENNRVAQLQEQINELYGEIALIEESKRCENIELFTIEVRNLLTGVGKGYVEGDYYAPTRYYSQIPGVKNLRYYRNCNNEHCIDVKVVSPAGYLLSNKVLIDCEVYNVVYTQSRNYSDRLDY